MRYYATTLYKIGGKMNKINKKVWFLTGSIIYFVIIGAIIMFAKFAKVVDIAGNELAFMDGMYIYKWNKIYETFLLMGEAGRKSYTVFHILDYFFLTSYAVFMMSLTLMFLPKDKKWIGIVVPIIPAFFDCIENTILEVLSALYPTQYPFWAKTASVITTIKWGSGVIWFLVFIAIVVVFCVNKAKSKNKMI